MIFLFFVSDFTSVNSFQEEVKFSSSFYNLAPPPPPVSRPPPYEVGTFQTPTKGQLPSAPPENYYAATDIVKVSVSERKKKMDPWRASLSPNPLAINTA